MNPSKNEVTDLIREMAGVVSVDPLAENDEGDWFTFVELNGTSEAWITLAALKGSVTLDRVHVQQEHIEGVDGHSNWLVVIEPEVFVQFALALADHHYVNAFAGRR
jgi:hypothetical protein